jgi:SAM-dependent methyltransferase
MRTQAGLALLSRDKQLAKARFVRKWMNEHLGPQPTIADISCGSAFLAHLLEYGEYVGVDHPDLVGTLAPISSRVAFVAHDFEQAECDLSLGSPADLVISFETIEHVTDPAGFLIQIHRNLKPRGSFILSTPNNPSGAPPRYADHVREYSLAEMAGLMEASGFHVVRAYALGVPFGLITSLLRRRSIRVYRHNLREKRGFLSRASDHLPLLRRFYCRIAPYNVAGLPLGDSGETMILIASPTS